MLQQQVVTEIDLLAEYLRARGVPWRWAAAALVTVVFPIAAHNARHPEDQQVLKVSASGLSTLPAGRKPRHAGRDVREWVEWWYRHHVKLPPDTTYQLAKEYAGRVKRRTRADSVVADGLVRAENLLRRSIPLPLGGG